MPLYSPATVLLLGGMTFIGLLGVGLAIERALRFRLPAPWNVVAGVLIGVQSQSLAVQFAGMVGSAGPAVLKCLWLVFMAVGMWCVHRQAFFVVSRWWQECGRQEGASRVCGMSPWAALPLAITIVASLCGLAVAVAPTTRWDELYYHMLVPSRIVADAALRFYRLPWEGAIMPQMTFQIGMAPLHAIGYPGAASVVSWSVAMTLVWFAWWMIRQHTGATAWAWLWAASLVAGYYPVVYWVTGGPHAMGDLATAAAVVAVLNQTELLAQIGTRRCGVLVSLCLLAAVSTKITLLPLAAVIAGGFLVQIRASKVHAFGPMDIAWWLAPWIVFYLPLFVWTTYESGSPFGPVLAKQLGRSIYSEELLSYIVKEMRWHQSRGMTAFFLAKNVPLYSALFAAGVVASMFVRKAGRVSQCLAVLFLGVQTLVVVCVVSQYELRFYGGLLQGLVIHAAMSMPETVIQRVLRSSAALLGIVCMLVLPWFAVQVRYAWQFVPVTLGIQDKDVFHRKYVSFYEDYNALDRQLPKDAVILSQGYRANCVYVPRPIYLTSEDLPRGKPVFLLQFGEASVPPEATGSRYRLGEKVYENPAAEEVVNARLGGRPIPWLLRVYELRSTANEAMP